MRDHLLIAAEHLYELGADVLVLGCTELPLVLEHTESYMIKNHEAVLVDPKTILALSLPVKLPTSLSVAEQAMVSRESGAIHSAAQVRLEVMCTAHLKRLIKTQSPSTRR